MADILYGFESLASLMGDRIEEVGINIVQDAINASLAEHTRQLDAATALFKTNTTQYQTQYDLATHLRSQPIGENGRADPVRVGGHYDVAWPIDGSGNALADTEMARRRMTVEEAMRKTAAIQEGDKRWMIDYMLAALFRNTTRSWIDKFYNHGTLTVQPLANGDTVTYWKKGGNDAPATDTHHLTASYAGSAISDSNNPFPTIYSELEEHAENRGQLIHLCATSVISKTKELASYEPIVDPNISRASSSEYLVGTLGVSVPGRLWGYEKDSQGWIVEWARLPAEYIISVYTEGPRPLAMREFEEADMRGFYLAGTREDWPYRELQYQRWCGFGALNRVGAVVTQLGNAGAYAIPSGYTCPPS